MFEYNIQFSVVVILLGKCKRLSARRQNRMDAHVNNVDCHSKISEISITEPLSIFHQPHHSFCLSTSRTHQERFPTTPYLQVQVSCINSFNFFKRNDLLKWIACVVFLFLTTFWKLLKIRKDLEVQALTFNREIFIHIVPTK